MVSYPSYDPNIFSRTISNKEWDAINSDISRPIFNRATQGNYAPGSTFKLLVAMSALENKAVTPDETIYASGIYPYGYNPKCWIYTSVGAIHGYITVSTAIKVSCNCYFYEVGRRLGIEHIVEYCKRFGLRFKNWYRT